MKKWFIISLLLLLTACSSKAWTESEIFMTNDVTMIGIENKLGFEYDTTLPIKAGKTNKYLFHFWGQKDELLGKLEVVATHQESGKTIHVFSSQNVDELQPLNGADHHLPVLMTLPDSGMWKIEVMFDTVLFDAIYVNVQP